MTIRRLFATSAALAVMSLGTTAVANSAEVTLEAQPAMAAAADKDTGWTTLLTGILRSYQPGVGVIDPPVLLNQSGYDVLKIELSGVGCFSSIRTIYVTHVRNQRTYDLYSQDREGAYLLAYPHIEWITFETINSRRGVCDFALLGRSSTDDGDDDDGEEEDFWYAGSITYLGGLQRGVQLELDIPVEIEAFKLVIPSFCAAAEVLQAGTITEGVYDEAERLSESENVFAVNGGAGMRIRSIDLVMNGPLDLSCEIPVYVR